MLKNTKKVNEKFPVFLGINSEWGLNRPKPNLGFGNPVFSVKKRLMSKTYFSVKKLRKCSKTFKKLRKIPVYFRKIFGFAD